MATNTIAAVVVAASTGASVLTMIIIHFATYGLGRGKQKPMPDYIAPPSPKKKESE